MRIHAVRLCLVAAACVAVMLQALAQAGNLTAPETLEFDDSTNQWHWTVMTGEGNYGYVGQYQRRAKATTAWPSSWTDFVSVDAGDGNENVERRVSIPSSFFDRNTYDFRIRVYYQIDPGLETYDDSPYTVSSTLEGYEPTAPTVTVSVAGNSLVCAWTEPSSGAHEYEVRSRLRDYGTSTWGNWSTATTVSASASRSLTLSTSSSFRLRDWECGVTTLLGTTKSTEATGMFFGEMLAAPSTAEIVDNGSQLQATWSAVLEATSYQYRSASRSAESSTWGPWSDWESTSGTRATLGSNSDVYSILDWRIEVRSHNGSFQSDAIGAEWEGREPGAPSPPANLQIERHNANQEGDELMAIWNPPDDGSATSYQYRTRRRTAGDNQWSTFDTESSTTSLEQRLPAVDSTDIDGNDWEIQVRSVGSGSLFSQWISATFMRPVAGNSGDPPAETKNWPLDPVTCGKVSETENGITVNATYGLASGIQCQEIGDAGIGIRSVIDAGYSAAVDVWGYVEQGAEVCFEGSGSLTFLDALTAPRTVRHIGHYRLGDQTCAWITTPGSIVLATMREGDSPQLAPGQESARDLVHCMVTTTTRVNFRSSPGGSLQGNAIDSGASLNAVQRVDGWFRVDNMGVYGWISALYVRKNGACA